VPAGNDSIDGGNSQFGATHWSMVMLSAQSAAPGAEQALEELCRVYWYPLYAFVRRKGHAAHDAQDLTQGFLVKFLESKSLGRVDPQKGKFRSFLLGSLQHFLADAKDRERALKRGGGAQIVHLDDAEVRYSHEPRTDMTPEKIFEVRWATSLIDQALLRVKSEMGARGKAKVFDALKEFITGEKASLSYEDAAKQLDLPLSALKTAIHRLRRDYRVILREEIARTLSDSSQVDDEIRHLCQVLAGA
jgi:DNA-directed RNA polymerase specialized sigma24 family protein